MSDAPTVRVLLVDDEPLMLRGLVRRFRNQAWDIRTAGDTREALALLAAEPSDVIVSDIGLPGDDGTVLLGEVRARHPGIVRMALSASSDFATNIRAAGVAHRFFSKPSGAEQVPDALNGTIERARDAGWPSPATFAAIRTPALPVVPHVYRDLLAAFDRDESDVAAFARLAEQDPAISAKLVQLANSCCFGLPLTTSDVFVALGFLGVRVLRHLALGAEILRPFPVVRGPFSIESFQKRSVAVARTAERIGKERTCYLAGLLHGVGELVAASQLPEADAAIHARVSAGEDALAAERDVLGCTRSQLGGFLLELWGMPAPVVRAVLRQDDSGTADPVVAAVNQAIAAA
jgi:HD-like signal output (HDOD) protein/ActR/RegA family two-component response regulator